MVQLGFASACSTVHDTSIHLLVNLSVASYSKSPEFQTLYLINLVFSHRVVLGA
jgi:hypothetical protein